MIDILWFGMLFAGIITAFFSGTTQEVTDTILSSSKEAVTLCITMCGIMSVWTGLMRIAQKAGLVKKIEKLLEPVLRLLFPEIKKGNAARGYMVTNIVANLLGLGWAATPAGLKAMQELQRQNPHPEKATTGMCTFLIVNISSLQLIPVNIIAYRSQFQSVRPAGIVAAGLLATTCSTLAGILFSVVARKIAEKKETLKCR